MRVEIPISDRALGGGGSPPRARMSGTAITAWLLALAGVATLYLLVATGRPGASAAATLPWVVAPFLALAAWANAASRTSGRVPVAFGAIAVAGGLAAAAPFAWMGGGEVLTQADLSVVAALFLFPYIFLAAGVALSLGARREWTPAATVDAALLALAGAVATLRLVVEPLRLSTDLDGPAIVLIGGLQVVVLLPVFAAALLVLRRGSALSPVSAAALMGATLAFALGAMLALAGGGLPQFTVSGASGYVWVGGWMLLAFSGLAARDVPSTAAAMLASRRTHDGIRRRIVPIAALILAAAAVDVALRPPARLETVLAIAALGLVLALRTAHAFNLADREVEQRRQLAHTRALVKVTHALAGTTDLAATLDVISRSARTVLGTEAAGIELVGESPGTLEVRSAVGLPDGFVGLRFPVESSFTGWVVQQGEPRATADAGLDPFIHPRSVHFLRGSPLAAAPIRFHGETLGALFACIRSEPFDAEELDLLGALAEQASIAIENARLFERVRVLSVTDPLTGLSNRRHLERELEREFAAARRGRPLVAVIFDLDEFKEYNDRNGHLAGDQALQVFARAMRGENRAMNLSARYGGDEFVALLTESDLEGAEVFVDRVRIRFGAAVAALGHGAITVSAGMAEYRPGMETPDALLRAADDALYRVKPRIRT